MLLENGAFVDPADDKLKTPLHVATRDGTVEVVNVLIQNGADVNANDFKGRTPLQIACKYAYFDRVKILLENGADPNLENKFGKKNTDNKFSKQPMPHV